MDSYRLCEKDYRTEEEPRAQQRAAEALMNESMNIASYERMIMNWKSCERKLSWPYYQEFVWRDEGISENP
jgi:hypothetical protein